EQALAIDPDYAPAHAGLAQTNGWLYEWYRGGTAALDAADRASQRALQLAPELSEAHVARGAFLATQRRYPEALREYREAIALHARSFEAHYLAGRACFASGDIAGSVDWFRRGGELRPEDYQCPILLEQSLRMLGRTAEATAMGREGIRRVERHLELDR